MYLIEIDYLPPSLDWYIRWKWFYCQHVNCTPSNSHNLSVTDFWERPVLGAGTWPDFIRFTILLQPERHVKFYSGYYFTFKCICLKRTLNKSVLRKYSNASRKIVADVIVYWRECVTFFTLFSLLAIIHDNWLELILCMKGTLTYIRRLFIECNDLNRIYSLPILISLNLSHFQNRELWG